MSTLAKQPPHTEAESKPAAKRTRSDRARSEAKLGWMLAGPALVVMLAVTLYPILQAAYDSLFDYRLTTPDLREFVWFNNYLVILTDPLWWRVIGVTKPSSTNW